MEMRSNQKYGDSISLLGFGTMRLPRTGDNQADIDPEQTQKMVDYAIEHGVNYFDTAYRYHDGASELVIGEALSRHPRASFHLATKLPTWLVKQPEDVPRLFDEQLEKCKVDYFDYYLVHSLDSTKWKTVKANRIYEQLLQKKSEGKIRRLGFSFHDGPALMREILGTYEWDFAQIQLNYMDWEFLEAKDLYRQLTDKNIPVIVMEPVRGGALVNLGDAAEKIFRQANPQASIASWAIRFAASLPNVLTVLSGMSNLEQVQDNIATLSNFTPLSDEDRAVIHRALEEYRKNTLIPCTGCGYCMDCPFGVDIPRVLGIYNQYCTEHNQLQFELNYDALGGIRHASNCTACGVCKEKCPQAIDIPHWLGVIGEFVEKIAQEA